jgi:hypothetical protein
MQPGAIWKLKAAILGVRADAHPLVITLPQSAALRIVRKLEGTPYVEAEWDRLRVLVFEIDLRDRGERILAAGEASA